MSIALVTGGARGIGRATAVALAATGARVAIADLDADAVRDTARAIGATGWALDVTDAAAFAATVEAVQAELGPIDVLVNNAGIMSAGAFLDQDPRLDDRQIDVNLRGVIHGMRAVLPGMLGRGRGHVVNVASVAGRVGVPYTAVYAATKHAVVGLTEAVRHEYRDRGVWFTYVLPSIVRTELTSGLGRLRYPPPIEPEDVAAAIVGALSSHRVDVFVPRFARLSTVLPSLLPRSVVERVGRWFGVNDVFAHPDTAARTGYQARLTR
ncbi:MAG: SDR family oxidoreductase [Myxococcota bacterium]